MKIVECKLRYYPKSRIQNSPLFHFDISLMPLACLEVSTVVDNYIRYGNGKRRNFLTVNGSSTVVNGMRPNKTGGLGGRAPRKNFLVYVKS